MAGHSKWANIKHRKAAQDAKRGKAFTKLIRELVVAAKQGGAVAEDNPRLRAAVDKHELPVEAFEWFLDLRRYGSVPHAGFGLGLERCVAWICGLHHVRETIPFARTMDRLRP